MSKGDGKSYRKIIPKENGTTLRYDKILLGATKDNELVFAEFGITDRNGYPEFTASFDTVRPFDGDSVDLVDYWDNYIEECGAEYLRDLLGDYDCELSELAEMMADDMGIKGTIDCSLYPEIYTVDGIDWYFESMGCGQHDTRGEMAEYVNEDAYNMLHELWDKCHLKKVNSGIADIMEYIAHVLGLTNTEDWITDYIHRHIDELR